MKWITKIAYGTGQMLKDLVAGVISTFYIVFYGGCISLSSSQVGTLLLVGQVANGLATPLIGFLSDRRLIPKTVFANGSQVDKPKVQEVVKEKKFFSRVKRQLKLGRRKSWHLGGCMLMLIGFPLMFGQPESFIKLPVWAKLVINGVFMIFVQVGWAAIQIPHLSIINDLTDQHDERVLLASLRYFFSGIGDMFTLLVSYFFFESEKANLERQKLINYNINYNRTLATASSGEVDGALNGNKNRLMNESMYAYNQSLINLEYKITIEDLPIFRGVALIVTGIGALFIIIFHCGVREGKPKLGQRIEVQAYANVIDENLAANTIDDNIKNNGDNCNASVLKSKSTRRRTYSLSATLPWYAWFTLPRFWLSCSTFSIMRLSVTVSAMYMSPFLLNSLQMDKSLMVSVPLVTTVCCLVTSVVVQRVTKLLGNYIGPIFGVPFILSFCVIAHFLQSAKESLLPIYFAAAILGIGNTINSVRALVVVTTLIGVKQVQTAAFVHGIASFFDKILTGLFIQCIQLLVPELTYRHIQVYIVGSLAVLGGILATIDNLIYSEDIQSSNIPCLPCFYEKTFPLSSSILASSPPLPSLPLGHKFSSGAIFNIEITDDSTENEDDGDNSKR